MANVLLTGAAGAIGMDLAFSLNQAKINVFATEADQDNFFLVHLLHPTDRQSTRRDLRKHHLKLSDYSGS